MEVCLKLQVCLLILSAALMPDPVQGADTCAAAGHTSGCCVVGTTDCSGDGDGESCYCDLLCHSNVDCCEDIFDIGCYDGVPANILQPASNFTYTVAENETAIFQCVAEGTPPPAISWLRNSTLLGNDSRITISEPQTTYVMSIEVSQTLMLANTRREDNGMYTCRATNNESTAEQHFYLVVQVIPVIMPLVEDQLVIANVSDNVSLTFHVDSNPRLSEEFLKWFYSPLYSETPDAGDVVNITNATTNALGSMLQYSDLVNDTVTLTIVNIVHGPTDGDPTNKGRYFLMAVQPHGSNYSYVDLEVFVIPEPPVSISSQNFSTHWILIEWELPVQSGNTHVVLQQYSTSNETVTVLLNATQTSYNASEEITPYSSYVFYIKVCNEFTCSQFNDGPSANITTAEDFPTEPRDCLAMSHTSTSIALSWSTPLVSNGILLHYTITFLPLNAIPTDGVIQTTCMTTGTVTHNIPDSIEISAQHNTTVLTGLLKHTPYSFGITASTSAGEGPPSTDLCTATTLQDVPDSPPTSVNTTLITPTLLEITWQPPKPECQNGAIASYLVQHTRDPTLPLSQWTATNSTATSLQISLPVKTSLDIRVSAATQVGYGPSASLSNSFDNIITTRALFELRLTPVSDCSIWTQFRGEEKSLDIKTAIVGNLQSICLCNVTETNIISNVFSCRLSSDSVVFKAELFYTDYLDGYTADDLISLTAAWSATDGGTSLLVDGSVLVVDPECPIELESLQADDCVVLDQGTASSFPVVTVGAIAGAGILVLALAIVAAVACIIKRLRGRSNNRRDYENPPEEMSMQVLGERGQILEPEEKAYQQEEEGPCYETIMDAKQRKISKVSLADNVAYVRSNEYVVDLPNTSTTPSGTEQSRRNNPPPLTRSGSDLSTYNPLYGASGFMAANLYTESPPQPLPDDEGIYWNDTL